MFHDRVLRIGHLSTFYHTSFILMGTGRAEEKLSTKVKWTMFGGGPAIVEAFSRGEIDLGYVGLPPVMIGIGRGVPIVCVGGGHVEGTVMIGPPGAEALDETGGTAASVLEQFRGGIIGCPPAGSIHDIIIRDLINNNGLGDSIRVRNFAWADAIPDALADNEVDAAIGTPPLYVAAYRACKARIIIPPDRLWPWNPSYGIIVSRELLQHDSGLVEGFLRIHEDASNLIRKDPKKAAQIVEDLVKVVDGDFIRQTYSISPKYCASLPREYKDATIAFAPVLKKLGYIDRQLSEPEIFESSLIEKVHTSQHHYYS